MENNDTTMLNLDLEFKRLGESGKFAYKCEACIELFISQKHPAVEKVEDRISL